MFFIITVQQSSDSNWVNFFTETYIEALELVGRLTKENQYTAYYIAEVLDFSTDFHSEELNLGKPIHD